MLDLTLTNSREGETAPQIRDRAADFYRTTKSIKDVQLAQPRDIATGGQNGFELKMTYKDSKGEASTFVERTWKVTNRVYALRLAAKGEQTEPLGKLMDAVGGSVTLDRKVTEAPGPGRLAALAKRVKESDLRELIPLEQYLLYEFAEKGQARKPVGYLFIRFEKAKFLDVEGWYMRVRSLQVLPDGNKIREKAWSFVTPDWSRERWATTAMCGHPGAGRPAAGGVRRARGRGGDREVQEPGAGRAQREVRRAGRRPAHLRRAGVHRAGRPRGPGRLRHLDPPARPATHAMDAEPRQARGDDRRGPADPVNSVLRRVAGQTTGQTQYIDGAAARSPCRSPSRPRSAWWTRRPCSARSPRRRISIEVRYRSALRFAGRPRNASGLPSYHPHPSR